MTLKINFNLNLPDSCCTLVPKNGVWTVPKIAACQIAKNAALLIPDYSCDIGVYAAKVAFPSIPQNLLKFSKLQKKDQIRN